METTIAHSKYKLPAFWVFIPGLLSGAYLFGAWLVGASLQFASGYQFIAFVVPLIAGTASLTGLLGRLFHWKISIALAVLAVASYWVPVFFFLILSAGMIFKTMSIFGAIYVVPTLILLAIIAVVPTISVARIHRWGVLVGILVAFVCTALASFGATPGRVTYTDADAEGSAVKLLRTLNVALDAYAKKYDRGYVDMLQKLGRTPRSEPDMNHAAMFSLDERSFEYRSIPNTFEKKGYIFTYTPGMDSSAKVASYTITARPAGRGGKRNFYSDQTYILRVTNENRPADASDPPF